MSNRVKVTIDGFSRDYNEQNLTEALSVAYGLDKSLPDIKLLNLVHISYDQLHGVVFRVVIGLDNLVVGAREREFSVRFGLLQYYILDSKKEWVTGKHQGHRPHDVPWKITVLLFELAKMIKEFFSEVTGNFERFSKLLESSE